MIRSTPSSEAAHLDHKNRATLSLKSSNCPKEQIRSTLSNKSSASILLTAPDKSDSVVQNLSGASIWRTPSAKFTLADLARAFPLQWSHYVLLISRSRSPEARDFYRTEALRGGWSVRQLARQIDSPYASFEGANVLLEALNTEQQLV